MFQTLFSQKFALERHRTGPLAVERQRYLQHCADQGATRGQQCKRAKCLLWIAKRMSAVDHHGVDATRLQTIVYRRPSPGPAMAQVFLEFGRPWLKFLGWWREESEPIPFPEQLEWYVTWMGRERGLSPQTIYVRSRRVANFLRWCGRTGRDLQPFALKISMRTSPLSRISGRGFRPQRWPAGCGYFYDTQHRQERVVRIYRTRSPVRGRTSLSHFLTH
jgi:hypothetical protein